MEMKTIQVLAMTSRELEFLTKQAKNLKPSEQLLLIERIKVFLKGQATQEVDVSGDLSVADSGETWTDEELEALFKSKKTLTGKEIVNKHLASGIIGSWSDMGIQSSIGWLEDQRAKRKNKYQW